MRFWNKALCFTVLQYLNDWPLHDDVIKWKHIPRYWTFVQAICWSPVNSPHEGQWRWALMFSLICARINGWVNNREAGDLRRHRAHYDVIVTLNTRCGILLRVTGQPVYHVIDRKSISFLNNLFLRDYFQIWVSRLYLQQGLLCAMISLLDHWFLAQLFTYKNCTRVSASVICIRNYVPYSINVSNW